MAEIAPFRGIVYDLAKAGAADALLAPPYDVISGEEQSALEARSPNNFVRLILPRGEGDAKYGAAAATLGEWQKTGVLKRDAQRTLYRYHQSFTAEGQTATRKGFICRVRLHRFDERVILPHERTLSGPKADRLKLKRACRAHLSQVFGLYSDPKRESDVPFDTVEKTAPMLEGKTADGTLHRMWRLDDPAEVARVVGLIADKKIYIADGHHRYETMLALREELRQPGGSPRSSVEFGTIFLCNLDDPGLLVFPTHRVVHGLASFDFNSFVEKLRNHFEVTVEKVGEVAAVRERLAQAGKRAPSFAAVSGDRIAYLTLKPSSDLEKLPSLAGPAVLRELDVTLLHALVIEGTLGISRAEQEKQTNLRYVKDLKKALDEARAPGVQAVMLMNPTPVDHVRRVADAGEVMPQKSTYFYPKIASGMVINPIDPAEEV